MIPSNIWEVKRKATLKVMQYDEQGGLTVKLIINAKKNKKGAALVWVLILMVVFVSLTSSMLFISNQDIFETVNHRERTKAYYLAESGIDLAYAALMKKTNPSDVPLIKTYQDNHSKVYTQKIMIGTNTVDIRIESILISGKWWVKITSVGTVVDSNISEATSLRINIGMDNFEHLVRENN